MVFFSSGLFGDFLSVDNFNELEMFSQRELKSKLK